MLPRRSVLALLGLAISVTAAIGDDVAERRQMIDDIRRLALQTGPTTGRPVLGATVLTAIEQVPRHQFVPRDLERAAYRNRPLPIGHGQTISQPFMVALMTDLLDLKASDRVLEVGTGSGYQAAVLAQLAAHVFTIELIAGLAETAASALKRQGYNNITTRIGDGYEGWPEEAPFDAIIVTAAPEHVPEQLLTQLRPGGRMVLPVGTHDQELIRIEKRPDGTTIEQRVVAVRFVPMLPGPETR